MKEVKRSPCYSPLSRAFLIFIRCTSIRGTMIQSYSPLSRAFLIFIVATFREEKVSIAGYSPLSRAFLIFIFATIVMVALVMCYSPLSRAFLIFILCSNKWLGYGLFNGHICILFSVNFPIEKISCSFLDTTYNKVKYYTSGGTSHGLR